MASEKLDISFYTIFCGVFIYEGKKNNGLCEPWTERIDAKAFYNYIGRIYYDKYVNNIFKGAWKEGGNKGNSFLEHNSIISFHTQPLKCETCSEEKLTISIPYFDSFLFSDGIGIFCFKVEFAEGQQVSYQTISQLLGNLRNPQSILQMYGGQTTVNQFIQERLEIGHHIPQDWNRYFNQLKVYTMINDPSVKRFTEAEDNIIFELSHTMPIGTINAGVDDKPADSYYREILNTNSISIYDNWKAISLLDSFTRISCDYPDRFKTWELDYFHIYVHCLYSKFQLYYFNSQLTDLLQFNKKTQAIRDRFIEFVNDYSLPYISYKFLPNLLYEKMNSSLEIKKEQDAMEKKIDRLNEVYQNKKSKQLNTLLLIISILSLASVFNDLSQWLTNMGASEKLVYNPFSIFISIGILATIAWLIFRKA